MAKRVLITGAAGFVGANLSRRLLRDGHDLHLLVSRRTPAWRIDPIRSEVRVYDVDLRDGETVARVVRAIRPEWVFHLAAYGAYPSQTALHRMVQTNIVGTINLVEAYLRTGWEAFVNTGSSSEYGFKDHAASERELLEPNSHYAVTKASATLFCRYTARSRGVHLPTLRLYSVYGPFEEPGRLIPTLALDGLEGKLPPLVSPDVARDYVCVEDVTDAYLLAAARTAQEPGAIYNVGTGVQTPLREVVALARRVLGIPVEPAWGSMPPRQWDTPVWVSDARRIRDDLGWRPRYTLEAGFRLTVKWFQDNRHLHRLYRAGQCRSAEASHGRGEVWVSFSGRAAEHFP
ncbi:MAG: NAD-dependent epimerase/dehydratase family protein [Candidatus Rokubacteria bacterium]|nr:NAD-dependent epimerase/dehydratase family protein [Candidatus Rokubacteria bacterium]